MENIQIAAWNEMPGPLPVLDGHVDVWRIFPNLRNNRDLPEEELQRCEAINNALARQHELSSRIGVRRILGRYTGVLPSLLAFERAGRGKPFLAEGPQFNLSHTRDQILLGVSHQPVGLDVESRDRKVKAGDLASKFFHKEELAAVMNHADSERVFLKYWVCKEATVKLSGDGIYHGLRDARIEMEGDSVRGTYCDREVCLSLFAPAPGFIAAVASWETHLTPRFFGLASDL